MQLNAIMCVWNEEDIITATVKHAFAQGCSNVYFIDNSSTDNTVIKAKNAGAKLLLSFQTKVFDEYEKIHNLNAAVQAINAGSSEKHIWWLYIDADEFPNINCDVNICNFLESIDGKNIHAIHGSMYNHIPTHPPYYIEGYHPVDFMQICTKTEVKKIPLIKYLKDSPHIYSMGGAHTIDSNGNTVNVLHELLNIHHFNYRDFNFSSKRLENLVRRNPDGTSRIDWMDDYAKRIHGKEKSHYHEKFSNIQDVYSRNKFRSLKTRYLPYNYRYIQRWYNIIEYIEGNTAEHCDMLISKALHYYFVNEHEKSSRFFLEALNCKLEKNIETWIKIKIADCLSYFDMNHSQKILDSICNYCDEEMAAYIKMI